MFANCGTLRAVESAIDYTKHSEHELVEMFDHMDPRYAPVKCARLAGAH
jgi:hypothetical protein